jgi:Polyketide cyclase / dehydrase and lipid transport
MKTLKIIGIVVLAMVIIVAIVIVMQPEEAHIEKSIVINAPATSIFPEVSNYKNFNVWSPWTKMDPVVNQPFEGAKATVSSKIAWEASKTGIRSQRIEEIEENKRVKCAMTFNGYDGKFYSEFKLTPEEDGTRVTWTYDGQNVGLKGKAIWVFAGSVLSSQYQQGLIDLKHLVEDKIDH